jgi:hypothetical protein
MIDMHRSLRRIVNASRASGTGASLANDSDGTTASSAAWSVPRPGAVSRPRAARPMSSTGPRYQGSGKRKVWRGRHTAFVGSVVHLSEVDSHTDQPAGQIGRPL